MFYTTTKFAPRRALFLSLSLLLAYGLHAAPVASQGGGRVVQEAQGPGDAATEPAYREYRGVHIGMSAAEARRKLGEPEDKSDKQDFYSFSDKESAQVFYDAEGKVFAISVIYFGDGNGVPTAKSIIGSDIEANGDGSVHKRVEYSKAGYWVSYSRTAGKSPMTTIVMQKRQ